ncbi:hypothetical protein BFP70_03075 [Thioclava sp. SK-1]|uniref:hypothetical protein n=1 Tax=Thioclava sp. SK-1 TaxID=1889770 RepID=UPI00082702DA|nr:hypothetical protein [Thioclava sp. SK-1]OCX67156.1 hypothetical protein BFP70_03075 [Thioclava sp. SK-1]
MSTSKIKLTLLATATALACGLSAGVASADPRGCPPGHQQGHGVCGPPGQVKKHDARDFHRYDKHDRRADGGGRHRDDRFRVGDRMTSDYIVIKDPRRYGLDPHYEYRRHGDQIYRVDRDSQQILALIGAVTALMN